MYDWANSAYVTTVVVAVLPIYFAGVVVPPGGWHVGGHVFPAETLWGLMVSTAAALVFLAAPVLGAVADFSGTKKKFLFTFCYTGAAAAALLPFCRPGDLWAAIILFVISQVGFIGANIFYDAFLPQIAERGGEDRVSSLGFAYGYVGGGLQFAVSLALLAWPDRFGLTAVTAARIAMFSAVVWWAGFALVPLALIREPPSNFILPPGVTRRPLGLQYLGLGFSRVIRTLKKVTRLRHLVLFLVAFLVYNDGIQTVIEMATIYGKQELALSTSVLMGTLLLVQIVAIGGSLLFAWIASKAGTKRSVMLSLAAWCGVVIYAYFIRSPWQYVLLGGVVGLILGGSQAISRSLYASMIPEGASAEFFGFYSVVNKFSSIWGPFLFAVIRQWSGSSRAALLSVIVFFVLGLGLLALLDEEAARRAGRTLEV